MPPLNTAPLLRHLDPVLWIVTARSGARHGGLAATFVSQASIVPDLPRMLVGISRQHFTWELIEESNAFALHLLDRQQAELALRFGMQRGRETDKLAGLALRDGVTGSPLLDDALGWLECRVEARMETGDRTVYLGEVVAGALEREEEPLSLQWLLAQMPPERTAELKRQLADDARLDADAIRAWRGR